ncbi:hypothetical protein [Lysobacter enzymogenes]|uniref:hypothetical protein n=1 Tax=Lysobacter enzymogenes TaxID=69 RepID=UPI0019D188E9|nr:hypothetical protein [Lysobacter enzymogenes]
MTMSAGSAGDERSKRKPESASYGFERPYAVIPAQAGIHFAFAVALPLRQGRAKSKWIPACAGMTG